MKKLTSITRFSVLLVLIFLVVPQLSSAAGVRRIPLEPEPSVSDYGQANLFSTEAPEPQSAEPVEIAPVAETTPLPTPAPQPEPVPREIPEEPVNCQFEMPEMPVYSASFVGTRKKGMVANGEAFETKVYIKNASNVPWFSSDSGCPYLITNLGTELPRDRESVFYTNDLLWESDWTGPNRIAMDTKRVDPGELALFKFWSKAPMEDGWYREYFAPVIEGVTWLDGARFFTDIKVGDATLDITKKELLKYVEESTDLTKVDLGGEKSVNIQISTQRMQLKIGNLVIRDFPISTGTTRTPTPLGTTSISHKQEVRVAAGWPHYIMPKWMTYRGGGYGIHALPSLGNDNGVFWREALNHIGTRRSHGCVRLLPQDAEFAYNFTDIGTTVHVVW